MSEWAELQFHVRLLSLLPPHSTRLSAALPSDPATLFRWFVSSNDDFRSSFYKFLTLLFPSLAPDNLRYHNKLLERFACVSSNSRLSSLSFPQNCSQATDDFHVTESKPHLSSPCLSEFLLPLGVHCHSLLWDTLFWLGFQYSFLLSWRHGHVVVIRDTVLTKYLTGNIQALPPRPGLHLRSCAESRSVVPHQQVQDGRKPCPCCWEGPFPLLGRISSLLWPLICK